MSMKLINDSDTIEYINKLLTKIKVRNKIINYLAENLSHELDVDTEFIIKDAYELVADKEEMEVCDE